MVFGVIAAVLQYNVSSRTLAEPSNRYLGIPLLSFFDDFGAPTPSCLTPLALQTCASFWAILGIQLKETKSACGPRLVFLGMEGFYPCKQYSVELHATLPPEKERKLAHLYQIDLAGKPHRRTPPGNPYRQTQLFENLPFWRICSHAASPPLQKALDPPLRGQSHATGSFRAQMVDSYHR